MRGNEMGWMVVLAMLAGAGFAGAEPLRVVAIGDSLTEEYRFEVPFSAPDARPGEDPLEIEANVRNWVEILEERRPGDVDFGDYERTVLSYPDFRNGGYERNFGVPGFTTSGWVEVIESTIFDAFGGVEEAFRWRTRLALIDELDDADVAVIFLGGNDLKSDYNGIFHDVVGPAVLGEVLENLEEIHDFIRSREPGLPIVIATVPDIAATPEIANNDNYEDPVGRVRARGRVADLNAAIRAMAAAKGAAVARVDRLTDEILDAQPFHVNGTVMFYQPDPYNPPDRLFCKDGFHPSTVAQAQIANRVLVGIGEATGRVMDLLEGREVLTEVLGLNADQPYLDWAGTVGAAGGMLENPDGDGFPNLVEYALGGEARAGDSLLGWEAGGVLVFSPEEEALRFLDLRVMESTELVGWVEVPEERIEVSGGGEWRVMPGGEGKGFYRLEATAKP